MSPANMKRNNNPAGVVALSGGISWGIEIACLLTMALGVGAYWIVFLDPDRGCCVMTKASKVPGEFKSFETLLICYKLTDGSFPSTSQGLEALVEKPTIEPVPAQWTKLMSKVPLDPWGNPYSYRFPGSKDPAEYEILSSGPDGIEGTADDLSSQDE